MLSEKPRTSVEIRQRFNVSREHSARLLKGLFDRGLVVRNDSGKPFVYEITEAGRHYLSAG
jgi:predicted transcriptional regulator